MPKEGNLRGATMRTEMGTYHIRPFGQPCIEGFFGGRFAQALEDAGDGAIAAHSIDEIVRFLGNDFRRKLKPLSEIALGARPVRPRLLLARRCPATPTSAPCSAAPVDGRLFFAGEATSPHFFSTAHWRARTRASGRRRKCWRKDFDSKCEGKGLRGRKKEKKKEIRGFKIYNNPKGREEINRKRGISLHYRHCASGSRTKDPCRHCAIDCFVASLLGTDGLEYTRAPSPACPASRHEARLHTSRKCGSGCGR